MSDELLQGNKLIIADIKTQNSELDNRIRVFEQVNQKNSNLRSSLDEELAALKAANFEVKPLKHYVTF